MPEFENLDQYETTDAESGRKRVIPIAPHSTQPSNYRPQRRENFKQKRDNQLPPLKKADFEVVSVEQMEREFKRASRREGRSRVDRPKRNPLKDLRDWFLGLFRKKKKSVNRFPDRARSGRRTREDGRAESKGPRQGGSSSNGNRSERSDNADGRRPKRRRQRSQGNGGSGEREGNRDNRREGNSGGNGGGNQERREESRPRGNSGDTSNASNGPAPSREGGQNGSRRRKRNRRPGRSDNGGSANKGPDRDSQ